MQNIHSKQYKIGILGGGQLGRMTLQEAYNLNLHISVLDPAEGAPSEALAHEFVKGDFKDFETVYNFGKNKEIITIEFEDVNVEALEKLENEGVKVFPQSRVLRIIQDKGLQKQFYRLNKFPTANYILIDSAKEAQAANVRFPVFQKLRRSGYDGYGVQSIDDKNEIKNAFDAPSVLEEKVDLQKELSVIVARNESGECKTFPMVELEFNPKANMVEFLFSPAIVDKSIETEAYRLAKALIQGLDMVGILAVEFFLSKKGELMINEIAPRSHNSGHHSIEANYISQFGQHIRAILNLPLGKTDMRCPAVMINLLGEEGHQGTAQYEGLEEALNIEGVYPHLYGKEEVKSFRKMGHITILNENLEAAKAIAHQLKKMVKVTAIQKK